MFRRALLVQDPVSEAEFEQTLDVIYQVLSAFFVFFLQAGFTAVEVGAAREASALSIVTRNVAVLAVGAFVWWFVGFAFAQGTNDGENANGFIGVEGFLTHKYMARPEDNFSAYDLVPTFGNWSEWFYQWTLAQAANAVIGMALTERCTMTAHVVATIFFVGFFYPVVVHWVFSSQGWLSSNFVPFDDDWKVVKTGLMDYGGSVVLFVSAGTFGFVGNMMTGPRIGRFTESGAQDLKGNSPMFVGLGTAFLWFGWYGLTSGQASLSNGMFDVAAKVAVVTTMAASGAGIATYLADLLVYKGMLNIGSISSGVIAGLVSINSGVAAVEPWAAVVIGVCGAFILKGWITLMTCLRVDDPTNSIAIYFGCGLWAPFAASLWATETNTSAAFPSGMNYGAFYGGGGDLLWTAMVGVCAILAWITLGAMFTFGLLSCARTLRIDKDVELETHRAEIYSAKNV